MPPIELHLWPLCLAAWASPGTSTHGTVVNMTYDRWFSYVLYVFYIDRYIKSMIYIYILICDIYIYLCMIYIYILIYIYLYIYYHYMWLCCKYRIMITILTWYRMIYCKYIMGLTQNLVDYHGFNIEYHCSKW